MQPSRSAALLNTLLFLAAWVVTALGVQNLLGRPQPLLPPPTEPGYPVLLGLLLAAGAVIVVLVSRSDQVLGLGESGRGLRGLLNWALCGLLAGIFSSLLQAGQQRLLGEDHFLDSGLNLLFTAAAFALAYWLVFRRSPFATRATPGSAGPASLRAIGVFMLLGGLFVAGVGGFFLLSGSSVSLPRLLAAALPLVMGLSGVCLGLGLLLPRRARVAAAATLAGTLLAAVGMVLGVVWVVVRLLPG